MIGQHGFSDLRLRWKNVDHYKITIFTCIFVDSNLYYSYHEIFNISIGIFLHGCLEVALAINQNWSCKWFSVVQQQALQLNQWWQRAVMLQDNTRSLWHEFIWLANNLADPSLVTRWGWVMLVYGSITSLVQIMACCLFGVKPLFEPMLW